MKIPGLCIAHKDVLEKCRDALALDSEPGSDVRAILAMASAVAGGNISKAAALLHSACVVTQIAAGEPLEDVLRDTRDLFATVHKMLDDEKKGIVTS